MITPLDTQWGKYKEFEGAWYKGSVKFDLPDNPTVADLVMNVITSTEGGAADAVNAYDKCMVSVGYFQWCEIWRLTSQLLWHIQKHDADLLDLLQPALDASGAYFQKDFFWEGEEKPIRKRADQQRLFLLNSNGRLGTWDEPSKDHVKLWVASLSNVLAQPEANRLQVGYTAERVKMFASKAAKKILFDDEPDQGWVGGLRAGFLSFAANNPAKASENLVKAVKDTAAPKWNPDWCIAVLKQLTFGPKITIYPHRYNKIRPVIERLYGIDLPDFARELKKWQVEHNTESNAGTDEPDFGDPTDVQQQLVNMGYDLGHSGPNGDGVDGAWGRKSDDALKTFQSYNGLRVDGELAPKTRAKLLEVWRAKVCS